MKKPTQAHQEKQPTIKTKPTTQQTPTTVPQSIPHLQQTVGNQATTKLLQSRAQYTNTPIHQPPIQAKLQVNAVGDKYEQEADAVAKEVVQKLNTPQPSTTPPTAQRQTEDEEPIAQRIQRQTPPEEEMMTQRQEAPEEELQLQRQELPEEENLQLQRQEMDEEELQLQRQEVPEEDLQLQRSETPEEEDLQLQRQTEEDEASLMTQRQAQDYTQGGTVPSNIETQINQSRGSGRPMEDSVRQPMEQAFGADFSDVRIHTNAQAHDLNQSIQARAFTTGNDIFFKDGEYSSGNSAGQELLAHELTHTIQQAGSNQSQTTQKRKNFISRKGDSKTPASLYSGHYQTIEHLENGTIKKTNIFLNINQLALEGNYRSFINLGNGFKVNDSGDISGVRDERSEIAASINYQAQVDGQKWQFEFWNRNQLITVDMEGQIKGFKKEDNTRPITTQDVSHAPTDKAIILDQERHEGLTPDMLSEINTDAFNLIRKLNQHKHSGTRGQRKIIRTEIADKYNGILDKYIGSLRERAKNYLLERLRMYNVYFLGEADIRADIAVIESIGGQLGADERESIPTDSTIFRYDVIFRGIKGKGKAGVGGLQYATGSMEVKAYRASTVESNREVAWNKFYYFNEIQIMATAGAGLQGGVYWKTFHATSSSEWTEDDFVGSIITVLGLSGPSLQVDSELGPLGVNLASWTAYQFEGVNISTTNNKNKQLELLTDEKTLEWQSDLPTSDSGEANLKADEEKKSTKKKDNGDGGVQGDLSLGELQGGIGYVVGLPGYEYSSERQQLSTPNDQKGDIKFSVPEDQAKFSIASDKMEGNLQVDLSKRLTPIQHLIQDQSIPIRIVGHASSLWRGDKSDAIQGNLNLSRKRAVMVAEFIRSVFELPESRILDIIALGDQEHRSHGGTIVDDDPNYRRVDIIVEGKIIIPIYE